MRQFLLRKFKILHTIWKETVIIIKYGIFAKKKKKREREEKREEGDRGDLEEKRESQKGREQSSQ